jgi:hypothetical protein
MLNEEYKQNKVFEDLLEYEEFYKSLSYSVMGFITHGTKEIINFDTYMYSSMQGTLESIRTVLEKGRLNDGYALLRKYYDSVMINIYAMLFLNDEVNILVDSFFVENKISNWLQGKEVLPGFGIMKQYIRKSEKLKTINDLLYKDTKYSKIRDRCNGNTHYNFFYYVMLNDNEVYIEKRNSILNMFSSDLRNLFILHIVSIFTINAHYMSSSDYVDYLDMGDTPPENSQYWVSPFIQRIFDNIIKKYRPDLATEIIANTSMELE